MGVAVGLFGCTSGPEGTDDGDDTAGGQGTLDSVWKRVSSDVTILDTNNPFDIATETVTLPGKLPLPDDDRQVDVYQQIVDDTLVTYALVDGDEAYYRTTQALQADDGSFVLFNSEGTHLFELRGGHLTDTGSLFAGDVLLSFEATYDALEGSFPPAGWPTVVIDAVVPDPT